MDTVANLPADERRLYFEQAAAREGRLSAQLMEKDFWVCLILSRLFSLERISDNLTFKGGTSLSKVYRLIERFSEDIDVSIEREFLGFGGDDEPEKGNSGKEKTRRLDRLKKACQEFVADQLQTELRTSIEARLNNAEGWDLSIDADDPDHQSIRFQYPQAVNSGLSAYFAQSVKIELGARSDHFPVQNGELRPYLHDVFPDVMELAVVRLRVLDAERTFWEKATILHANHHQKDDKPIGTRQSRHYYDLFQIANSSIGERAIQRLDLLERVAFHKDIYFKAAWARYDLARPGTLRLVPPAERTRELQRDYADMQPMIFGQIPDLETILNRLQDVENAVNAQQAKPPADE